MTNNINTLNGALTELGETMAYNLMEKGVEAYAEEGLMPLAMKISEIETSPQEEEEEVVVDYTVRLTWHDNNNSDLNRPASVTIRLYAYGEEIDSCTVSENYDWQYTFSDLPQMINGHLIQYSINIDPVIWYMNQTDSSITNNSTIHMTYQPEVTSYSASVVWNDNNNALNLRPGHVAMSLSNGTTTVTTVILSELNGWTATVYNLPTMYNGQTVTYCWQEGSLNNYILQSVTQQGNVMIFTNTPSSTLPGGKPPKGVPLGLETSFWYCYEDYETPL